MYCVIILETFASAHWVLTQGKAAVKEREWAGNMKTLKLMEWVITDLKGKGMKPYPCYWTRMQNPSPFSSGRCKSQQDVRVSLLFAHPPALVRALSVQRRKRIPQEQPSRKALSNCRWQQHCWICSSSRVCWINFCKDVLQRQSWWFKALVKETKVWHISRLMDRSSPLVQRRQWLLKGIPLERNVAFCVCYTRQ